MILPVSELLVTEDLLHYLWKFRLFQQKGLETTDGHSLDIISVGIHNKHAGPDFDNVKIKIDNTIWAGSVEIHIRSSDWEHHKHQLDKAYENVVLHVVYQHDKQIAHDDGTIIPVLVLQNLVPDIIALQYQKLMNAQNWIPCQYQLPKIDAFYIETWLSRLLIERFEERIQWIDALLLGNKGSWNNAFYIALAKGFGFKTNALPFELLARSIPQQILAKHKNNALQVEALLFGQAGFLTEDLVDDYPNKLRIEYLFLQKKYSLTPLDRHLWKFMRLRPYNFPTLRLAQFAALMVKPGHLFSQILDGQNVQQIRKLFENLVVHPYWQTHYRFDIKAVKYSNDLGDQSIINLSINVISIFLFAYGKQMGDETYMNRAIVLLEKLSPEVNQTINRFKEIGIKVDRAHTSQALLQLKARYCDKKKCLHCGIGMKLLNYNQMEDNRFCYTI